MACLGLLSLKAHFITFSYFVFFILYYAALDSLSLEAKNDSIKKSYLNILYSILALFFVLLIMLLSGGYSLIKYFMFSNGAIPSLTKLQLTIIKVSILGMLICLFFIGYNYYAMFYKIGNYFANALIKYGSYFIISAYVIMPIIVLLEITVNVSYYLLIAGWFLVVFGMLEEYMKTNNM